MIPLYTSNYIIIIIVIVIFFTITTLFRCAKLIAREKTKGVWAPRVASFKGYKAPARMRACSALEDSAVKQIPIFHSLYYFIFFSPVLFRQNRLITFYPLAAAAVCYRFNARSHPCSRTRMRARGASNPREV